MISITQPLHVRTDPTDRADGAEQLAADWLARQGLPTWPLRQRRRRNGTIIVDLVRITSSPLRWRLTNRVLVRLEIRHDDGHIRRLPASRFTRPAA